MSTAWDLVCVGTGITTLYTLWKLQKLLLLSESQPPLQILILDSKKTFGGRITTYRDELDDTLWEMGPGRFSSAHSCLQTLLKDLKLKPKQYGTTGEGTYYALRIPYTESLRKNQDERIKKFQEAYQFSVQEIALLKSANWDPGALFERTVDYMVNQLHKVPDLLSPKSELSRMTFFDYLKRVLTQIGSNIQTLSAQKQSRTLPRFEGPVKIPFGAESDFIAEPEAVDETAKGEEEVKAEASLYRQWKYSKEEKMKNKDQKSMTNSSSGAEQSDDQYLRLAKWLKDSIGYNAEFEMNAIFGLYLVAEFVKPAAWFSLPEGLDTLVEKLRAEIFAETKKFKISSSFRTKVIQIQPSVTDSSWILRCDRRNGKQKQKQKQEQKKQKKKSPPLQVDGDNDKNTGTHKVKISARNILWTGSPHHLPSLFPPSFFTPYQELILSSVKPQLLLRIFAKYNANVSTSSYWYKGLPRVVSTTALQMVIPVRAGEKGILQVSYSDHAGATPWITLLKQDQKNGKAISISNRTPGFVGTATSDSETAKEITKNLRKLFPERSIPKPEMLYWHPCICHYQQPFSRAEQDIIPDGQSYHNMGMQMNFLSKNFYLAGEASNNFFLTYMATGWMESGFRSSELVLPQLTKTLLGR